MDWKQREAINLKIKKISSSLGLIKEAYNSLVVAKKKRSMKFDLDLISSEDHSDDSQRIANLKDKSKKFKSSTTKFSFRKSNIQLTGTLRKSNDIYKKVKFLESASKQDKSDPSKDLYLEYEQHLMREKYTSKSVSPLKKKKRINLRRQNNFQSDLFYDSDIEDDDLFEQKLEAFKELGISCLLDNQKPKKGDQDMVLKEKKLKRLRESVFKKRTTQTDENDSLKDMSILLDKPKKMQQPFIMKVESCYFNPFAHHPSEVYLNTYFTYNSNGEFVKKCRDTLTTNRSSTKPSIDFKSALSTKSNSSNYNKFKTNISMLQTCKSNKTGHQKFNSLISISPSEKSAIGSEITTTKNKRQSIQLKGSTSMECKKKLKEVSHFCSNILTRVDRINNTIQLQNDIEQDMSKFKKNELIKVADPGIILFNKDKQKMLGKVVLKGLKTYETSEMFTDVIMKSNHVRKLNMDSTLKFSEIFKSTFHTYSEIEKQENIFKNKLQERERMIEKVEVNSLKIEKKMKHPTQ